MRHSITVEEYEQMTFGPDERVELIRGEIVPMSPIGDFHKYCVDRLTELLVPFALSKKVLVSIQSSVVLADSEPEPDVTVLRYRNDRYRSRKRRPPDILLLVEVADTTLETDRNVKGPLYAEAGIAEYWLVNLPDECVEVHRDPRPDGYFSIVTYHAGESIEIPGVPGKKLPVAEIL